MNNIIMQILHYAFSNFYVKLILLAISVITFLMVMGVVDQQKTEAMEKQMHIKTKITCDKIELSEDGKTATCFEMKNKNG